MRASMRKSGLAWACTIHKAQGATLARYVLYLEKDCFSHGQMYTAFTRASGIDSCGVRVPFACIDGIDDNGSGEAYVRNVVDQRLLLPQVENEQHEHPRVARSTVCTPHRTHTDVVRARKDDFVRLKNRACMCCAREGGELMNCYSCNAAVHKHCVCNARLASSSWADPVWLQEHFCTGPKQFVCPDCYNDYHEMVRVSNHCDAGYLNRQGRISFWVCSD